MQPTKIDLLVLIDLEPQSVAAIESAGLSLHFACNDDERSRLAQRGDLTDVRAVLTNGSTGCTADQIALFPKLEIICALGAGYEKVDRAAAGARAIVVTNGRGTNDASVADHAMALLLAIARDIRHFDSLVRGGEWARLRRSRPMVSGKKLGIVGLGNIGAQIARRAAGGFDMQVAYHNRRPRPDVSFRYFATVSSLAAWSDFLVIATPGGSATHHLVDASVLTALGRDGYLVNISRGSVVDTAALIEALTHEHIGGAALDVVEGEPVVPEALLRLNNVVFTPHVAGRSPESVEATVRLFLENVAAHFAGGALLTPVPMSS